MGHRAKMRKISGKAVAPEQSLAYCGMASQADVRHLRASDSGFFFCGLTVLQRIPVTEGAAFTSRNCSPPDRTLAIYVAHLVSLPHFRHPHGLAREGSHNNDRLPCGRRGSFMQLTPPRIRGLACRNFLSKGTER